MMNYNPATHTLYSRITPQYNLVLKQGLCAGGNGTTAGYTLTSTIAMAGDWSILICFEMVALPAVTGYLIHQFVTVPSTQRFYASINSTGDIVVQIGTGAGGVVGKVAAGRAYCLKMVYNSTTGKINGTLKNITAGTTANLTEYTVAGLTTTNSTWRIFSRITADGVNGNLNAFVIWNSQKTLADMTVNSSLNCIVCHPCDGTLHDISGNNNHGVNAGLNLAAKSDYSSFRNDEYGFAIKSGVIYPKLLDGTGYSGLVGSPDAVYEGLIATKGQIDIAAQAILGTLFDFVHDPNTEIEGAGISWDDWDGEDANEDTVGTAETDLDTDYYNAITASLMTNTSIAGYAGTSNVSKRLFFKVADRVMKHGDTFLAESGTVQEILVYKTDLTAGQIAKVRKYCKDTGV